MYARTTTVRGDPSAMDEGIAHVRDVTWAELQHMSGCVGLSMLAERDTGRCIVTTAWATDEAMRASAELVRELRRGAAEALRAERVDVEEWEIAVLHRVHPAGDGACARVIWAETPGGNLDQVIDAFRMDLMPRLEGLPGFCSVSMMVDRMTGRAAIAVTYADRDAMMRAQDMASAMREEFAQAMGARITEVAEFDLVLAHLRVPEMA
jgi:S-adenosylmethionine/arginine decarboxylase-like enzyme